VASFDYVIVGGGSAGCVLANRLSADSATRVLVLEAGRPDYRWDVFIHMPAALSMPIGSRFYDWRYRTDPEQGLGGRRVYQARGKVLGGSSSINGMVFQRGNPLDFERWAALEPALEPWDYARCLPYFKRIERTTDGDATYRGRDGHLPIERRAADGPLFQAFFEAVQEAGYELTDDLNASRQEGFAPFDSTISRGRRVSAARAFLHPVMSRPNLEVRCRAFVTKIRFRGTKAVGVEYTHRGRSYVIDAGEVILAGGAINSPQLLQLSGVGPVDLLADLEIPVVSELAGVGENLQDHLEVYVQHAATQPVSVAPALKWRNRPTVGFRWLFLRDGPGASNHFEAGGFLRSNESVPYPNVMIHFLPLAIRYDGSQPVGGHGYQLHIGPTISDARGSVRIRSRDPRIHPSLLFNYLSTDADKREWLESIACARHILAQPAWAELDGGEISPGPDVESDASVLAWVARDAETALHPCGTCRMGTGAESVVDPGSLRVHGVDGLRVVDASVFPLITNANIYAPTLMVAERAADLISGNQPLPADQALEPRAATPENTSEAARI
jgi:choline dehydrogenase